MFVIEKNGKLNIMINVLIIMVGRIIELFGKIREKIVD